MGAAPVNDDTNAKDRVFVEQYDYSCYHRNEVKNRNRSESSSEEDQSKIHDVDADTKRGPTFEVQARDDLKIQPQPPQGPNINWERFLPAKSVKVLLVESDDSTRHVVSALLRNCSYEVTAVAHGLQAWTTLQDMSSHIDLVLTEVVMPFLSGFELLCRIMGHKNLKNIPVIMMSSHDSMGIVFKCLSKGAVDFLVKPIRKNELKNLWQHVWRRCHYSSGGSGSESGTQAKQSGKFRVSDDSESNTSSTNEHENGSNGLSIQSSSDDGSRCQTSWTKTAAEVNSIRPISPWNQGAEAPDSTCAQVVYIRPEKLGTMDEDPGTVAMIKDVGIGISERQSTCKGMRMQDATPEIDHKPHEKGSQDQNLGNCGKFNDGLNDVSGTASSIIPQPQSRDYEAVTGISTASNIRSKAKSDQREVPYLELTLKRLQGVVDAGTTAKDDHSILRHSDLSAFSKYNTVSSVNQGPSGNTGNSPIDNGSVAIKSERTFNFLSCSSGVQHIQQSSGSMNENELWLHRKFDAPDKVESPAAFKSLESSAFQPVQNGYICSPRKELSGKADGSVSNKTQAPTQGSNERIHIQHHHHHHHHHHYHHHVHNSKEAQQNPDLNELSLDNVSSAPPPSGSPNLLDGHTEENGGDLSGGGSASGSNHGSNGNNGMNDIPSQGMANGDSENGTAKHCGITGKTNVSVVDEDRHAKREAALTKFRLKRKERCFEKRVRYQSRKKLAEQRPRVRGQFVRQTMSDAKVGNESQSSGTKG